MKLLGWTSGWNLYWSRLQHQFFSHTGGHTILWSFCGFWTQPWACRTQGPSGLPIRCRFHLHAEAGAKCCGGNESMHWHDTNLKDSKSHNHHTTTGFFQPESFHFHWLGGFHQFLVIWRVFIYILYFIFPNVAATNEMIHTSFRSAKKNFDERPFTLPGPPWWRVRSWLFRSMAGGWGVSVEWWFFAQLMARSKKKIHVDK